MTTAAKANQLFLLEDKLEPLVREIAYFLVISGAKAGSRWGGYGKGDLRPLKREKNDAVAYVRNDGAKDDWQARIQVSNVHELEIDPSTVVIHPEIILKTDQRFSGTVIIDAYNSSSRSGVKEFSIQFDDMEEEFNAVSAAFSTEVWAINKQSVSAKVEAGPASAEAKAESEQGFRSSIETAWEKQTGRSRTSKVAFHSEEFAPPYTKLEQRLIWNEQQKQRRIECEAKIDMKIEMGRRGKDKHGKWGWASNSPVSWDSIDHLIAVAEKRGRVEHARYEHFSRRVLSKAELSSLERIKKLRTIKVDRLTEPYSGAININIELLDVAVNHEKLDMLGD